MFHVDMNSEVAVNFLQDISISGDEPMEMLLVASNFQNEPKAEAQTVLEKFYDFLTFQRS